MIELLVAGAGLWWVGSKIVGSGDRAVKGAVRSAKRTARDLGEKYDTVLQPCASGRAPHTPMIERDYFTKVCRVCGKDLS